MREDYFFISNKMTANLEHFINHIDSLEGFERRFPPEFLKDDAHVGNSRVRDDVPYSFSHFIV